MCNAFVYKSYINYTRAKAAHYPREAHFAANNNGGDQSRRYPIIKQGFVEKQSLHLKQFRLRWIVLKHHYLYSYKKQKTLYPNSKPTEVIDLNLFKQIKKSHKTGITQFALISKDRTRVFIAKSVDDMNSWIYHIKHILNNKNIKDTPQENKTNDINHQSIIIHENVCDGIANCEALDRLMDALKHHAIYKKNEEKNNDKVSEYFNMNKHFIITDYHHILSKHLNEEDSDKQFKLIYDRIMNTNNNELCCDISNCGAYIRNNREREKDKNDINFSVSMDILDSIHCYFLHSIDMGYRIIDELKDNAIYDENDKEENICSDKQLFALKTYLKSKRGSLQQIRGMNRFTNNKFMTNFNNKSKNNGHNEKKANESADGGDNETEQKNSDFSFGLRFNCWDRVNSDYKIKPKYSSLKEEVISNKVYVLNSNVFDSAYSKAQCLLNESNKVKAIKYKYNKVTYGINLADRLNVDNILSIILYTDYDTLSYHFSSIFRKTNGAESDRYLIQTKGEYYHWIKILTETVNGYGTMMRESKIKSLYHGVSFMYFHRFIAQFDSPTSTTTKLQIATIFAKNDGIILELSRYNDGISSINLVYFNCTFISYFGNEDERLFIQPPRRNYYYLKFVGIRNMKTNENYAYHINVLATFQKLVNCIDHDLNSKVPSKCINIINDLMDISSNINNTKYPIYVSKLFQKWTDKVTQINMDRNKLRKYALGFRIWNFNNISHKREHNLIRYVKRNQVFKQIISIRCSSIGKIDATYLFSLLSTIKVLNNLHDSKLKGIYLSGTEIMFSIPIYSQYRCLFAANGWNLKNDNIWKNIFITR